MKAGAPIRKVRVVPAAFSVLELMIVVAVLALLVVLFLPRWMAQHRRSSLLSCVNNQKQIGLAFRTWALDNNDRYPMQVPVTNGGTLELISAGNVWPHFVAMSNELSTPKILVCPVELRANKKQIADVFAPIPSGASPYQSSPLTNDDRISYFIGLDATNSKPNTWLGGDHNLQFGAKPAAHGLHNVWTNTPARWNNPWHEDGGYILLSDGSVSLVTSKDLNSSLAATGEATNHFVMP